MSHTHEHKLPPSGTGTVAWIPFRVVGQPGDRTALTVNVTTINAPNGTTLQIDRVDGQILVVDQNGLVPGDCDGFRRPGRRSSARVGTPRAFR